MLDWANDSKDVWGFRVVEGALHSAYVLNGVVKGLDFGLGDYLGTVSNSIYPCYPFSPVCLPPIKPSRSLL